MGQSGIANFKEDLLFAYESRKRLDLYFYPLYSLDGRFVPLERSPGSINIQRKCHVDCIVASKQGGSVTIEEKIVRYKGRDYNALTIETHSNLERTIGDEVGDGWIKTSVADYLLYGFTKFDGHIRIWVFNLPKLREWFLGRSASFIISDTLNGTYTTRCRVVPLDKIPRGCVRLSEVIV